MLVASPPDQLRMSTVKVVHWPGAILSIVAVLPMVNCALTSRVASAAGLVCPAVLTTAPAGMLLT